MNQIGGHERFFGIYEGCVDYDRCRVGRLYESRPLAQYFCNKLNSGQMVWDPESKKLSKNQSMPEDQVKLSKQVQYHVSEAYAKMFKIWHPVVPRLEVKCDCVDQDCMSSMVLESVDTICVEDEWGYDYFTLPSGVTLCQQFMSSAERAWAPTNINDENGVLHMKDDRLLSCQSKNGDIWTIDLPAHLAFCKVVDQKYRKFL